MSKDDAVAHISAFADFIDRSPSSYHAARAVAEQLVSAGFTELDERRVWQPDAVSQRIRRA